MIKKLSVLLLFVLSIPNAQAAIEDPAIQTALKAIYTEAGGDGWSDQYKRGWVTTNPQTNEEEFVDLIGCNAEGIYCTSGDGPRDIRGLRLLGPSNAISPAIGELTTLTFMRVNLNRSRSPLPDELGNLSNLESLQLENSYVSVIPDSITQLTNLKTLNFRVFPLLRSLPEDIDRLSNLESVSFFRAESLTDLPDAFARLSNLKELAFAGNPLSLHLGFKAIPPEVFQLSGLEELFLRSYAFEVTEDFSPLSALKELQLIDMRLSSLPESIQQLQNLEHLNLSTNHFTEIPDTVLQLPNLKYLNMYRNKLLGPVPREWINSLASIDPEATIFSYALDLRQNALYSEDPQVIEFLESKGDYVRIDGGFLNTQVLPMRDFELHDFAWDRERRSVAITLRWNAPELGGFRGIVDGFEVQVKNLADPDAEFVDTYDIVVTYENDEPRLSFHRYARTLPRELQSRFRVTNIEFRSDGYGYADIVINTDDINDSIRIAASNNVGDIDGVLGKASAEIILNDVDGDGITTSNDDFPRNDAASKDSDGDGMPDAFNPGCDSDCQTSSGLELDPAPNDPENTPPSSGGGGGGGAPMSVLALLVLASLSRIRLRS